MNLLRRSFAAVCAGLFVAHLSAAEPAIIAKARARLAPDAVLNAVRSLHYVGTLEGPDAADPSKTVRQSIEIYLQKPAQQRIVVTSDTVIEISALDGYDAWRRVIDAKDPTRWEQSQMGAEEIKKLRADVWQNLAYFRGIEKVGGYIEDLGTVKIEGVLCRKLAFHHSDTIINLRYFDETTGQLALTGTPEYNTKEQGDMVSGGIHFAKGLLITQTAGDKTITRKITFDKITVNETFPASLFAVPLATAK